MWSLGLNIDEILCDKIEKTKFPTPLEAQHQVSQVGMNSNYIRKPITPDMQF